jgi:photosystem II stability/assembly factor-like uncharacterized protein
VQIAFERDELCRKSPARFCSGRWLRLILGFIIVLASVCASVDIASAAPKAAYKALPDDLFSVTFPNEKEGWACGRWGTVLHTSDNGKTWTRQDTGIGYTLASIHFADARNGWAVGDEGTIIHTADGGKTWAKQKSPFPYFLMGVYFANAQKGWIVTERTTILHTEDGGKTWVKQFSDLDYVLKSISFCDERNGWAVGEYGFIYHTNDGGTTWKQQAGEFGISEESGELVAGNYLFSVHAMSPQAAWAVGIDGYVTRTSDGGKTWTKVSVPVPKVHLYAVAAKSGAVAIGGDGIFLWSSDGGITWKNPSFTPSIRYGWIYGVALPGPGKLVAVGWEGAVYVAEGNKVPPILTRITY